MTFREAFEIFHRDYHWWERNRDIWPTEAFLREYIPRLSERDCAAAELSLYKTIPALESVLNNNEFCTQALEILGDIDTFASRLPDDIPEDMKRFVVTKMTQQHCTHQDVQFSKHILCHYDLRNLRLRNTKAYQFYQALSTLFGLINQLFY